MGKPLIPPQLFYETPCPSAGHESTWDSLANWLLCTSQQGMLFSSAWIHNTAHMIESVCSDFALSEPIYHILNVRCSAHDMAPFLHQDPLDRPPSTAALMSLGEEILKLKSKPLAHPSFVLLCISNIQYLTDIKTQGHRSVS